MSKVDRAIEAAKRMGIKDSEFDAFKRGYIAGFSDGYISSISCAGCFRYENNARDEICNECNRMYEDMHSEFFDEGKRL